MSKLTLKWFKSKIKRDIKDFNKLAKLIEKETLTPEYDSAKTSTTNSEFKKPYVNVKLVNDVLTITLNDGFVLVKSNASIEDFNDAKNASCESELLEIVSTPEMLEEKKIREMEIQKAKAIVAGIKLLEKVEDFVVQEGSVYLKGVNRSMPQLLVDKFSEIVAEKSYYAGFNHQFLQIALAEDEEFQSLKRFFMWCCLNPRAEVAHELYRFLHDNSFRITKQGFFVALRNVVTLHGGSELVDFVSNTYNKVKAVWKKNPNNYHVILHNGVYSLLHVDDLVKTVRDECEYCEGTGQDPEDYYAEDLECSHCEGEGSVEYHMSNYNGEDIGVLTDLYLDLPNRAENRFTDDWTKTFDIRIGRTVSMPQEQCNWSTQDCAAAGLHFTADQIHYVGCGDTSVLVLINPMKVVGIGQHKGRCYEYLPIMTVPREEATEILHDIDFCTLSLDEDYAIRELEDLEEKVKEGFSAESTKYEFNFPQISTKEISNIVLSLDEMRKEISKRVSIID